MNDSLPTPVRAVTFDFGQTLAELDGDMLAQRLRERGVEADPRALDQAVPRGFARYNQAIAAGQGGHPWHLLMATILEEAGVAAAHRAELTEWLWSEQPRRNLWRRPITGMIELCRELHARGVALAVISNSEGKLAELAAELGWAHMFAAIADSGALGIEKPDPRIFRWTAERLGVQAGEMAHIGDSLQADVVGALGAGCRAIWFTEPEQDLPAHLGHEPSLQRCTGAAELRTALQRWAVLPA
jgi:putative hydrolase of the HAD superfamily